MANGELSVATSSCACDEKVLRSASRKINDLIIYCRKSDLRVDSSESCTWTHASPPEVCLRAPSANENSQRKHSHGSRPVSTDVFGGYLRTLRTGTPISDSAHREKLSNESGETPRPPQTPQKQEEKEKETLQRPSFLTQQPNNSIQLHPER